MSATILGKGEASLLMETDYMQGSPQVHLHFLTGPQEYDEIGYGKVELCCHGCGESILLYYTEDDGSERCLEFRDQFTREHRGCKNHNFEKWCPDYRSSHKIMDFRVPRKHLTQHRLDRDPPKQTAPATRDKTPVAEFVAFARQLARK